MITPEVTVEERAEYVPEQIDWVDSVSIKEREGLSYRVDQMASIIYDAIVSGHILPPSPRDLNSSTNLDTLSPNFGSWNIKSWFKGPLALYNTVITILTLVLIMIGDYIIIKYYETITKFFQMLKKGR